MFIRLARKYKYANHYFDSQVIVCIKWLVHPLHFVMFFSCFDINLCQNKETVFSVLVYMSIYKVIFKFQRNSFT